MNIAQLAAINIGKSIVEEQKKDSGSLPESTKTSIIENVREYESGKYTGPSFVPFTPVSTKTTFTRDEAIKHVDRSILGLQTQQSYNQWIQGRLGEQRKNIDLDSKYMVNVDGREVETSGRGAHVYLFFQNIRARQQERRIKSAIHEAKGFRSTLRGYEKYGTTVTKTDRGWDIVFDPKEWERGEDARARRDWDFGYMIGTPVSRLLSRGNYIMESLRSGSYTPETGLVIGGEKLHPSNFGEDSSILSRGHYDYYKSDWGERFAKGITSEPVLMLVTGGVGAGVSAVGYSGLGATTVSVGSRAITGSTIARGAVTAGFVGMGAYGTYSTYQQDGIEAVEEQIKRAGVMSPLFIGAYQTGSGYGGQLAYKGYQFTQKYNIPSHPFRSGWSNIGKFTPAPIKNLYSDYNIAKSDFVNMGRMARVGSNWKPTITQRITGPFKSTFYRIGTRVKPVIESGWNKFRYHTMESSWRDYTLSKRANQMGGRGPRDFYTMKPSGSYGPHDSISWKPMASQREIMTSYEQLKARPIDRLGAQSPSKWGAYGTSWEAYRMIGPDFRYSMRPPVTSMYPSRDFLKPGGVQIDFAPSLKTKFNMKFYHSIDDLGLPSSELDTRVLGGYNQTTGVFETKTLTTNKAVSFHEAPSYYHLSTDLFKESMGTPSFPSNQIRMSFGSGYAIAHGGGISLSYLNWLEEGIDSGVHSYWSQAPNLRKKQSIVSLFGIGNIPSLGSSQLQLPKGMTSSISSMGLGSGSVNKIGFGSANVPASDYVNVFMMDQNMNLAQKQDQILLQKTVLPSINISTYQPSYAGGYGGFGYTPHLPKPRVPRIPFIPDIDGGVSKMFKKYNVSGLGRGYRYRKWKVPRMEDFIGGI